MSLRRCVRITNTSMLRPGLTFLLGLRPPFDSLWGEANMDTKIDQGCGLAPLEVKKGDRVRASLLNAQLNVCLHIYGIYPFADPHLCLYFLSRLAMFLILLLSTHAALPSHLILWMSRYSEAPLIIYSYPWWKHLRLFFHWRMFDVPLEMPVNWRNSRKSRTKLRLMSSFNETEPSITSLDLWTLWYVVFLPLVWEYANRLCAVRCLLNSLNYLK